MAELNCTLGKNDARNGSCHAPEECRRCGYEVHEMARRKQEIRSNGLTQRSDGLRGLAIRR